MKPSVLLLALVLVFLSACSPKTAEQAPAAATEQAPEAAAPNAEPITQAQIKAVVAKHMEELAICYNQANECEDPEDGAGDACAPVEGTLVLKWTVKKDGTTSKFELDRAKSSFYNEFVDTCITQNENADPWEFPKPESDDFTIEYVLDFKHSTFFHDDDPDTIPEEE